MSELPNWVMDLIMAQVRAIRAYQDQANREKEPGDVD